MKLSLLVESDLSNRAIRHFGVTRNIKEAGYILPDGTMLDLSGRHYHPEYKWNEKMQRYMIAVGPVFRGVDHLADTRNADHRAIGDLGFPESTDGMYQFMAQAKAIRYIYSGFSANFIPTHAQLKPIVTHYRRIGEPLFVDIIIDGKVVAARKFDKPTIDEVIDFFNSKI